MTHWRSPVYGRSPPGIWRLLAREPLFWGLVALLAVLAALAP